MGRRKGSKNKNTHETETENINTGIIAPAESENANSGDAGNANDLRQSDESVESETAETEKEIEKIMSAFSAPSENETPPQSEEFQKRERKPRKKKGEPEPEVKAPLKVPPKLLIIGTDRLFGTVTGLLDRTINKKNPIDPRALYLPADQYDDPALLASAEACLKEMGMDDNPIAAFFGTMLAYSITNYTMLRMIQNSEKRNEV